jgi:protein-S-isoprenylcysteine O-methyltransferase Ste14
VWLFFFPLLLGFILNSASAFTTAYSSRWDDRAGQRASFILRVALGMPLWTLGLGLAMRTPAAMLLPFDPVREAFGWLLVAAGCAPMLWGLGALGLRAAMPSRRDTLVVQGLYAHVRHPIHAGMFLEFAGLALLSPTAPVVVACALGMVWVLVQTRLEERDLLQRMPGYGAYMDRVPRFLPRLRGRRPETPV